MTPSSSSARQVAIITGASGGIGSAVADRLARDGFAIVVNFAGRPEPAEALVSQIKGAGGAAVAVRADVPGQRRRGRCSMPPSKRGAALMSW